MATAVARRTGAQQRAGSGAPTKSKSSLEEAVGSGVLRLAQVEHRHAGDVMEVQAGRGDVEDVGGEHEVDPRALELPGQVTQATRGRGARCR